MLGAFEVLGATADDADAAWFTAWTNLALALLTAAGLALALVSLWLDRRRHARERHDDQAGQARLVYAFARRQVTGQLQWTLLNNSGGRIVADGVWVEGVPMDLSMYDQEHRMLQPQGHFGIPSSGSPLLPGEVTPVEIGFIDAQGLRWRRVDREEPTRVIEDIKLDLFERIRRSWLRLRSRSTPLPR